MGLFAMAWAQNPDANNFWTGKVPLEGALSTNNVTPRVDTQVLLYFSVTPLKGGAVKARFVLPKETVALAGEALEKQFRAVAALETVTHSLRAKVLSSNPLDVLAEASLVEEGGLVVSRSFHLTLNPAARRDAAASDGVNSAGQPLIIFNSGK
jgi:hypothetical protein